MVFCAPSYRAYDHKAAVFTAPDWRGLLDWRLKQLYLDPTMLDLHQGLETTQALGRVSQALSSPDYFLQLAELNMANLLPQVAIKDGRLVSQFEHQAPFPEPLFKSISLINASMENFQRRNSLFEKLSVVRRSPSVKVPTLLKAESLPVDLSQSATLFHPNIIFKVTGSRVTVGDSDEEDSNMAAKLFNNTYFLGSYLTGSEAQTKNVLLFYKPIGSAIQDLPGLGLEPQSVSEGHQMNRFRVHLVRVKSVSSRDTYEFRLTNAGLEWRLRYGSEGLHVIRERMMEESLQRAEEQAWKKELEKVTSFVNGLGGSRWRGEELNQLKLKGRVKGFSWRLSSPILQRFWADKRRAAKIDAAWRFVDYEPSMLVLRRDRS
ncbi:Teneurin-2 [Cichlidogyrus casuarinus]|uniref:Teneurin-2 n=1 Tax=Cichlidogyrus casuarinus TaxID=1844966 RepID=A0ABD2Q179_9PLAT